MTIFLNQLIYRKMRSLTSFVPNGANLNKVKAGEMRNLLFLFNMPFEKIVKNVYKE